MLCLKVDNYQVSADSHNFILQESRIATRGKNAGKEIVVDVGYYTSLAGALKALLHKEVADSDASDIVMLLGVIERTEQRIKDAVREQCG
jgi:hypothetical protein